MSSTAGSVVVLFGLAACGSGGLDPGAGDDPGSGTGSLGIEGWARATPRTANARTAPEFDVAFSVRVSLNNQTVTTGTVTITSATARVPLTYRSDNRWSGTADGYDEVYVLDVVSGPDKAQGIRVDGPDIHVFSQPAEGASVDSTQPLSSAWQRGAAAESATLRTENASALPVMDIGSCTLFAGGLKADRSEARAQQLRLSRTNRVTPAGTAAGSSWVVTLENDLDVVAQPLAP